MVISETPSTVKPSEVMSISLPSAPICIDPSTFLVITATPSIFKPSETISEKLLKKPGIVANKKKVSVIKVSDDESPDFQQIADEMDQIFKKLPD